MRIGFVSTYPPLECGIATYTQYLVSALHESGNETFVMSQYGAQGRSVFPVFQAGSSTFAADVFNISTRITPDLVHIQHEYGLYGAQKGVAVIELILRYKLAGLPVAITLHTVREQLQGDEQFILKHIMDDCDAVIVHEEVQRQILLQNFGHLPNAESKVHVIEHGIRELAPKVNAKRKLDLEGKKVILLCGYFRPTKGFHRIVDIFPEIARQEEKAVLVVAGKIRNIEFDDYRSEFFSALNNSPVADRIVILRGQFPQHTFDTIVAAADVVVLPYEVGGQSGVMAQCYAQGVPVVTSSLPAFKQIIQRSRGGLVAETNEDYVRLILELIQHEEYRKELQLNIARYIKKHAGWSTVAERHCDVYHSVVKTPYGKARYVYFPEPDCGEKMDECL